MTTLAPVGELAQRLQRLDHDVDDYAVDFVDLLLAAAREVAASDVHLQPTPGGLSVQWRIDGVLQPVGEFSPGEKADVVARLKVMAELLTYRQDIPQEGRIRTPGEVETRVSTFPTLHGERAVVRLLAAERGLEMLDDLGLPDEVQESLGQLLGTTSGMIVVTGPAGSGKTTTLYACLREIVRASAGGRCVVSLEDPIEAALEGVAQSQVNQQGEFDLARGLRSLLRQDPEVIMLGEIRDRATAEVAFQAALTGQLVLTSFHAGSAAEAVGRLSDMGIEPYVLRSAVLAVVGQRLVRRLCDCSRESRREEDFHGLNITACRAPAGCQECRETGYRGRLLVSELLLPGSGELRRAILDRSDGEHLESLAREAGMVDRWQRATQAVEWGNTSPAEVRRVLGLGGGQAR